MLAEMERRTVPPAAERLKRIAILVSGHGRGSNMQAIVDACKDGRIRGEVVLVLGTRAGAPALERARQAGVPTAVLKPGAASDASHYGDRMLALLTERGVDLLCLAGYMRLLPRRVVAAYRWRAMNVHPALLPRFGGKGMYGEAVHRAVLDAGVSHSGCTVHFVDDQYDHGPSIVQTQVPVLDGDSPETLAARVLPQEHRTYVEAVALFCDGRVSVRDGCVVISPARGDAG